MKKIEAYAIFVSEEYFTIKLLDLKSYHVDSMQESMGRTLDVLVLLVLLIDETNVYSELF